MSDEQTPDTPAEPTQNPENPTADAISEIVVGDPGHSAPQVHTRHPDHQLQTSSLGDA